jgi:hypothetical protein
MDLHLQPLATTCFVSGEPFTEGARVASFLVRVGAAMEIVRYDVLESKTEGFSPEGVLACKWVHPFKPRRAGENPDKALKLTAESLFVTLADPTTERTPENVRLVQFLALMLERKRIIRLKGKSADGEWLRYEHAKSKALFEVSADELTPEFFVAVQEQLSVLVGGPKAASPSVVAPAPAETSAQVPAAAEMPAPEVMPESVAGEAATVPAGESAPPNQPA